MALAGRGSDLVFAIQRSKRVAELTSLGVSLRDEAKPLGLDLTGTKLAAGRIASAVLCDAPAGRGRPEQSALGYACVREPA